MFGRIFRYRPIYRCLHATPASLSRYDKTFLEPTPSKEELSKGLDSEDPRKYQPIKAATNETTSSLNFDPLVNRFIRHLIREGNKILAHSIVSRTFEQMKLIQLEKYHKAPSDAAREQIELDVYKIFHQAIENCKPLLITQRVKKGGVIYTVPIPVRPSYATFKAMKWLIESAGEKEDNVRIWNKLGYELIDAANNEGKAIRKKQQLHQICEANRAYAHFRW